MHKNGLLLVLTGLICWGMWQFSPREDLPVVKTTTPIQTNIIYSVSASGSVKQIRTSTLYSQNYSRIDKIYINTGDYVQKGQLLMDISPSEVQLPDQNQVTELLTEVISGQGIPEQSVEVVSGNRILCPFDGVITEICVVEQQTVSPFSQCIVISDVSRTQAVVTVSESEIPKLKIGMPASITGESFDGIYNGVVLEIIQQIKTSVSLTGASEKYAEVVLEFYEGGEKLMPGSSVSAKIHTTQKKNALTLPYEAITQNEHNQEILYVVSEGRLVERSAVTGFEFSNQLEILRGVSPGEAVVLEPSEELRDGMRVQVE